MFLKDSKGNKSMTATMAIIAFVVVMVKVLIGGASITIETFNYDFGTIDAMSIAALLTPILGTYAYRRRTAAEFETDPSLDVNEGKVDPT